MISSYNARNRENDFITSYDKLSLPAAWQNDLYTGEKVRNEIDQQAIRVQRAISLSVVCGQHLLLNIGNTAEGESISSSPSPTFSPSSSSFASSVGETKSDSEREVELIIDVVKGHANVSNNIYHLVFTKDTTCEELMQIAHKGQIFIAVDVHLASPRVLRALGEIMSLRATPTAAAGLYNGSHNSHGNSRRIIVGHNGNSSSMGSMGNNIGGGRMGNQMGSDSADHGNTNYTDMLFGKVDLNETDTYKFKRRYCVIAISRTKNTTFSLPYHFRCLFMLSVPIEDVQILKFCLNLSHGGSTSKTRNSTMDALLSEFERLSNLVHVSTHLLNYIDNVKLVLKSNPLIKLGPSNKKFSMSRDQRQRGKQINMDSEMNGLRVMAVLCKSEYLLPFHVKAILPDLLSHRIELHNDVHASTTNTNELSLARMIVKEAIDSFPPVIEHPRSNR